MRTRTHSAYTVRFRTIVVGAFIATCEQSMCRSQQVLSYSRWAPLRVYELSARAASTTSCKWCANATWHTVACMNVSTCCCFACVALYFRVGCVFASGVLPT
jgi:hypothetical protein